MSALQRLIDLKQAIFATYSLAKIPIWITTKTFLNNQPYSFAGHEFQETVLNDRSREVNCQKCSQIGMTEAQARWSLGICRTFPHFSLIYTMPYSDDAEKLCRTRIDPIIQESPDLRAAVNKELNNSQIKQIANSFIYFRGTQGNTQAISTRADAIVSDEIDRSSPFILSQYTSRLTHSKWKLRRNFSTPTVDGYGIAEKMSTSRRFRSLCKCHRCSHIFLPDYYQHVKIPGFDDTLEVIDKRLLYRIRYKEAQLLCPHCGKEPSLMPEHRMLVQENLDDHHDAAGYYISPFDAPTIITPSDLIQTSTEYTKITEFKNQNLGITAQDTEETLTREELVNAEVPFSLADSGTFQMGADMGLLCRIVVGRLDPSTRRLIVVHREKVPLGNFETRYRELARQYRVLVKVFDSQPYVDLIMRLQRADKNMYAGIFVKTKNVEIFKPYDQEEVPKEGKLDVKQVQINRNKAFDSLVGHIKKVGFAYSAQENEREDFINECLDMKRVQQIDQNGDLVYVWEKTVSGQDHYFFALLYLYIAAQLSKTGTGFLDLPPATLVSSFRQKQ